MLISQLQRIITCCQDIVDRRATLYKLAAELEMDYETLFHLLASSYYVTIAGEVTSGTTSQDILNVILLYFALKPGKKFLETAFKPPHRATRKP